MTEQISYHHPVMAAQCLQGLAVHEGGTYVDGTLGGGGHFYAIIEALGERGVVVGLDRDAQAIDWVRRHLPRTSVRVITEQQRFSAFDRVLSAHGIDTCDGILLDLGVSSHQIDTPQRGFSYQQDGALDMRMDPGQGYSAAELLVSSSMTELAAILSRYGEIRGAGRMAQVIKNSLPIETTLQLRRCLEKEYGAMIPYKLLSCVFQALRIAVNHELEELETVLHAAVDRLAPGGRLVVLSYHSLEDRIVKTFIRGEEATCSCGPEMPVCTCHKISRLKRVNRHAIKASDEEIVHNARARSARLRIAEKKALAGQVV